MSDDDEESTEVIKSVKLKYPIKLKTGDEIKVIDFTKRPVVGDLRGLDLQNLKMDEQCKILASITDVLSSAVYYKMDMADFIKVSKVLEDFLGGGQETETI